MLQCLAGQRWVPEHYKHVSTLEPSSERKTYSSPATLSSSSPSSKSGPRIDCTRSLIKSSLMVACGFDESNDERTDSPRCVYAALGFSETAAAVLANLDKYRKLAGWFYKDTPRRALSLSSSPHLSPRRTIIACAFLTNESTSASSMGTRKRLLKIAFSSSARRLYSVCR